jgi:hypothetical protein
MKRPLQVSKYVALTFAIVGSIAFFSSNVASQESKSSAPLEARFKEAIDAYSSCLLQFADTLLADASKSPEAIADESHVACGSSYAAASDAAMVFTASTVPKSAKLQAIIASMEEMGKYKAKLREITVQHVVQKRSGSAP